MNRTTRVALAALLLAPVAVTAGPSAPAGAAPAPILSVTSGAPGTIVTVSSPDCVSDPGDDESFAVLQARLRVGVAPDVVLAGVGTGSEEPARIAIPDWVDAAAPASIDATCSILEGDGFTEIELDPVAFDVLPGVGAPQQVRTFSRTSLLAGQGFEVEAAGCSLPGADYAAVGLLRGDDLGDVEQESIAYGDAFVDGTGFEVGLVANDARVGYTVSASSEGPGDPLSIDEIVADEHASTVAPGTYVAVTYCSAPDGTNLFYEPQLVEITGSSPSGDLDLTIAEPARTATLAGSECSAGDVDAYLEAIDGQDLLDEEETFAELAEDPARRRPFAVIDDRRVERGAPRTPAAPGRTSRDLADDGYLDATVTPEGGAWEVADGIAFDLGIVLGFARCGDPFADGFEYDPQAAVVDLGPVPEPRPPATVPVPATPIAAPAPAAAIPGRPTYAG